MNDFIILGSQQLFRSDSPRAKAPAPAVALKSGISRTMVYEGNLGNLSIAAAADGSLWTATKSSLEQYSPALGRTVKVCDMEYPNPDSILAFYRYVAPVSSKRAFFIQLRGGKQVISEYQQGEEVADLPALPNNESPDQISAASDGTLWALSGARTPYLREPGGSWREVAAESGTLIQQISVASATMALAIAKKGGNTKLLKYSEGDWVETTTPPGIKWVGACPDGCYWWTSAPRAQGKLHLVRPGLSDLVFPAPLGGGFTAANRRVCYFFSLNTRSFMCAAYGVLDQPAETWPTMNGSEAKGYRAISSHLGIIDHNGIRSQYSNANATFSIWYSKIGEMARPDGVPQTDWDSIRNQIRDELEYVQGITTLFVNIALLNKAIGLVNTNTYNQVVGMVGLSHVPEEQPKTLVEIVFETVVENLQGAVVGKAKGVLGSLVVDIGIACLKYAFDEIAKEHNLPDGSVPLKIACSDLAKTLADSVVKMEKARADFQQAIFTDWGKLGACGEAIRTGIWYWRPNFTYETIKDAGAAISLDFYQTLMPAKWKIILCQTVLSFQPPLNPFMRHVPAYSLMFKYVQDSGANRVYWWWACAEVGSQNGQENKGPYPNQKTLEAIFNLETTPLDFFSGANGWNLLVFKTPGYSPPPNSVPWQDYVNSPTPVG